MAAGALESVLAKAEVERLVARLALVGGGRDPLVAAATSCLTAVVLLCEAWEQRGAEDGCDVPEGQGAESCREALGATRAAVEATRFALVEANDRARRAAAEPAASRRAGGLRVPGVRTAAD
ncbi:hypothetical protein KCV87_03990 [Actinosynnema pretiosum subsp. pretiosum]|uniref:Uncharacterized protein n=1 Tax=Actinosynnema pretiosum subsp. pretiosum TaxID=103721 RepID=A0A1U9Y7S3_9PSEU|nr:hypothetical protein [Actinosynnema pretiosum subsp. pretiosum]AXX30588.1 hypothetical protein APASM_3223 [Actinosynnema pretiosum subsp. pretiosum]QUF05278.1 hypothetical protein KCV87_03990 [Actinosynnema pretiosum subsp. pretiosum]